MLLIVLVPGMLVLLAAALAAEHGVGLRASQLRRAIAARFGGGRLIGDADVVFQDSDASCGAAALTMLLRHRGRAVALDSIERELGGPDRWASFTDLQRVAARHGVRASGWSLSLAALLRGPLPAIAHTPGHFVVVDSGSSEAVFVRDPMLGVVRYDRRRFDSWWMHEALVADSEAGGPPAP